MSVFILIHGFSSSCTWFHYKDIQKDYLEKLDFVDNLKKIEKVYEHNINFFNLNYFYQIENDEKEKERMRKIYKKYKPQTNDLNFTIKDLTYESVCKNIYNGVVEKFGNDEKYILVCHSYGCLLGLCFNKMYKNKCSFNVFLDNPPYYEEINVKTYNSKYFKDESETVKKYFKTNAALQKILTKIKTSKDNVNDEILKVIDLIAYTDTLERLKYGFNELLIPTMFFKAHYVKNLNKFKNDWNAWSIKEKKFLKLHNDIEMYDYYELNGAEHFVWFKQKYSDFIIEKIIKKN
jgi:hypothetical protein